MNQERRTIPLIVLAALLNLHTTAAAEQLLLYYNFNDMADRADGATTPTIAAPGTNATLTITGGSYRDPDGQAGIHFTDAAGAKHPSGRAAAWSSGVNDTPPDNTFELTLDTPDVDSLRIRFDYRATPTGPTTLSLSRRVGDGDYQPIAHQALERDARFHETAWDITTTDIFDTRQPVTLRWTWSGDGQRVGTVRLDNLQATASP